MCMYVYTYVHVYTCALHACVYYTLVHMAVVCAHVLVRAHVLVCACLSMYA